MPEDAPESIAGTIRPSIAERSQRAPEASQYAAGDGPQHNDDGGWIETVIDSLNERSPDVRQALLKALLDGEKADFSAPHLSGTTSLSTHPVSGTSLSKIHDFQRFPTRSVENCVTQACHSAAFDDPLTVWNRERTSISDCVTRV